MIQWEGIQLGTMRLQVRSLASLSGLRIQHCCELWCRLQMRLGSGVAEAPAWEPAHAVGVPPPPKEEKIEKYNLRSSHCGEAEMNPTRNYEVVGLIPGLAQWVKDPALP